MTEVAFHFNMPDKTRYLCRLLRKAVSQGAQVAVTGPDAAMDELERHVGDWLQARDPVTFFEVINPRKITRAELVASGHLEADG